MENSTINKVINKYSDRHFDLKSTINNNLKIESQNKDYQQNDEIIHDKNSLLDFSFKEIEKYNNINFSKYSSLEYEKNLKLKENVLNKNVKEILNLNSELEKITDERLKNHIRIKLQLDDFKEKIDVKSKELEKSLLNVKRNYRSKL